MRESRVLGRRSRTERASIVSADAVFDRYGVTASGDRRRGAVSRRHVPTRSRAGMAQGMGIGIVMIFCLALAVAAVVIYFFVVGGTSAASGRDTAGADAPEGETETDREQRRSREGERPEHTAVEDKTHAAGIRDE
jgi:hypothetical protein